MWAKLNYSHFILNNLVYHSSNNAHLHIWCVLVWICSGQNQMSFVCDVCKMTTHLKAATIFQSNEATWCQIEPCVCLTIVRIFFGSLYLYRICLVAMTSDSYFSLHKILMVGCMINITVTSQSKGFTQYWHSTIVFLLCGLWNVISCIIN